jgi:hypothetical protein
MIRQPSESELARLADGTLPASRQAELRARINESPKLADALAKLERIVSMLRALDDRAPASLRIRIEAMSAAAKRTARARRPPRFALTAAAAVAVIAAVVLGVTGGGSRAPSVPEAARLALASSTMPAPAEDRAHPGLLASAVDGVAFPYWSNRFGWRAAGARTDTLQARKIVTVLYVNRLGTRVSYAIVARPAVPVHGGVVVQRKGVRYRLLDEGQLRLVTWLRSGHTCVLAARTVNEQTLLRLASGTASRSVPT